MQKNNSTTRLNVDRNSEPKLRTFAPQASSPCLQEARKSGSNITSTWVGNCGCTCLCPNPPK